MKIGIDVTWLKPSKSGGVESYFRNLLDGFLELKDDNTYYLLLSRDNEESFRHYKSDSRIQCVVCDTNANDVIHHLIWQNLHQWKEFKKLGVDICFFPVYEMPVFKNRKLKCVTTIHDIQAYHYPEYFPKLENIWYRFGWYMTVKNSDLVIGISDFTKNDLEDHFPKAKNIISIHNPIVLNDNVPVDFSEVEKEYNIKKNEYYYTVCSMHKHKNLISLVNMIEELKKQDCDIPKKLVISGVSGPNKKNFINMIKDKGLEENIILTKFVSNEVRNCLIKNCNVFLFPSLFEGFGMPPVEAMMLGARVISTKKTSLYEVTDNKCAYVEDPLDVQEWIEQIKKVQSVEPQKISFNQYSKEVIARQYLDTFYKVAGK